MLKNISGPYRLRNSCIGYEYYEYDEEEGEKPSSLYFLFLKVLEEEGEEEAIQLAKDIFSEIQLSRDYEEDLIDWAMNY